MNRNPERGCGTKKNDAYYLEGDVGDDSPLWAWTWVLGDGLDHVISIARYQIPTRGVVGINPAVTLLKECFVGDRDPIVLGIGEKEGYEYFLTKTKNAGSADHIGHQYYTPMSFAREVMQYGPSRRVPPQTAAFFANIFQRIGPFPMFFSHSQIPLFAGIRQRDAIYEIVDELLPKTDYQPWLNACWKYDEWGQYAIKNQDAGHKHYLVHTLDILDFGARLKSVRREPALNEMWVRLRKMFGNVRFEEQIFGASWMTKVIYTLPLENKEAAAEKALAEIPGITILDLEEQVD